MECWDAKFPVGSQVRLIRNVRNDGSFSELNKGDLLAEQGAVGEVRSSGYYLQNQIVYQVFFPARNLLVGIKETELIDVNLEWVPCLFRSLDKARLTLALKVRDDIIAVKGDLVEVQRVFRDLDTGQLEYEIAVGGYYVKVDAKVVEAELT
ncbi:nitrogen fixation protein NifZ [Vibrio hangzhouensis]|uniref:Nitrogen fixation protein NifZ n=1 Tax=Vibrio hangzhouensis TaxID=462991 RepID=A0A1H5TGG3_9VIBR|nr:nitrogen fixation protein NifZ [Vibrio hangzhouensis]SEF61899.1 nitrogen fixation protein NifZ [Vibrio hangzhouensis]